MRLALRKSFYSKPNIAARRTTLPYNFLNISKTHRSFTSSPPHLSTDTTGDVIVGIDLGTTNSCIAYADGDKVVIIENDEGKRTTPSIFAVDKTGARLVGNPAMRQMVVNPKNSFYATKRLIGRQFKEKEIQDLTKQVSYKIVPGPNGDAWVADDKGKSYSPSEVAANILMKLKESAEKRLGKPVNRAVITVPAYFDNHQRQATEDAGRIAGFKVERIINEPTAAALAYGITRDENKVVAVYDLGGGTFDISILEIGDGVFEVKSTSGDTFLGGEDFNNVIINWIISEYKKKDGVDLSKDKLALQRVREAAENAKHDLSTNDTVTITLMYIGVDDKGVPRNLNLELTRKKYEQLCDSLVKKSIEPCRIAIRSAGFSIEEITDVILVGGMTRMPKVRQIVKEIFQKEPFAGVNPDEAVASGAALQGAIMSNQGLILGEKTKEIVLLDVTPLNLGTSVHTGEMSVIIPAQTPIPCKHTKTFTTVNDFQTELKTEIYQGNRPIAKDNRLLGTYVVRNIPAAPKGIPKIDLTFEISASGIIKATSKDRASGKEQGMSVAMSGGLSSAEVERLKREAELNKEVDAERHQLLQLQEEGRKNLSKVESALKDYNITMNTTLEILAKELKGHIEKGSNKSVLEDALKKFDDVSKKILTEAYETKVGGQKQN